MGGASKSPGRSSTNKSSAKGSGKGGGGSIAYPRKAAAIPKWTVTAYIPPRKISDKELEAARKMFFELDRDGSGSIDAEELGMMLRSLGQNPSEQEIKDLIASVDDEDGDGQLQLREFLMLYTQGLDNKSKGKAGKDDVDNVFMALGGNPKDEASVLAKGDVVSAMMDAYELELDLDAAFGKGADTISRAELESFLIPRDDDAMVRG